MVSQNITRQEEIKKNYGTNYVSVLSSIARNNENDGSVNSKLASMFDLRGQAKYKIHFSLKAKPVNKITLKRYYESNTWVPINPYFGRHNKNYPASIVIITENIIFYSIHMGMRSYLKFQIL